MSEDVAQNRGGSRPYAEYSQYMKAKHGEEKAGPINTYAGMKVGQKNIDSNGNIGPIKSQKVQKFIDDYSQVAEVKYPNGWQQQPLDGSIVYNITGGLPHGRLAIGHGALKKADILAAAKSSNVRPSNSSSHQNLRREHEHVLNRYETETIVNRNMLLAVYEKIGMEVPHGVSPLTSLRHLQEPATGSSHGNSEPSDNSEDASQPSDNEDANQPSDEE